MYLGVVDLCDVPTRVDPHHPLLKASPNDMHGLSLNRQVLQY